MSFLLLPMEGSGTSRADAIRPKYLPALNAKWCVITHGDSGVAWADLTRAQEVAIALNADVTLVPPLDNVIAVAATKAALETLNMPSQWVMAGMTYRKVLRIVIGMAQLIQRMDGMGLKLQLAGNLDLTMVQIPAATRQKISDATDSLGLDRSGITGTTTVREALLIVGQQFEASRDIHLGEGPL